VATSAKTMAIMAIQGSLNSMNVADLLQFLAAGRKTGLLKISHAKVVKGIYFENGIIVGSSTNDPSEYLGQVLIHYGKINEPQLQAAMEIQRGMAPGPTRPRLGQILVSQGLLTYAEVQEVLKIRTLDIIYDLFIWKDGHFEFSLEEPLPSNFTRVDVEANTVVMEGSYRADELGRFRTLIPSDRTVLELGTGWTSSLSLGKETRELFYFLEKRMSVEEICYHMRSSSFSVYAQLYDLIQKGVARVAGELPETPDPGGQMSDMPGTAAEMLLLARADLDNGAAEKAISTIHTLLRHEPQNTAAHNLMATAEKKFIEKVYAEIPRTGVPKIVVPLEDLAKKGIGPQEAFVLSRINGEWDIPSVLSICPFREADSLLMIKKLWDKGIIGF
jgi:uncharacterized protein DUF4388